MRKPRVPVFLALLLPACAEPPLEFVPAPSEPLVEACTEGWTADEDWIPTSSTTLTRNLPIHQDGCGVYEAALTADLKDGFLRAELTVCNACEEWMAIRTRALLDAQNQDTRTVVTIDEGPLYVPLYFDDSNGGRRAFNCSSVTNIGVGPSGKIHRQLREAPIPPAGTRARPTNMRTFDLGRLSSETIRLRRIVWPFLAPPTGAEHWKYAFVPDQYCAQFERESVPDDDTGVFGATHQHLDLTLPRPFVDLLRAR